MSATRQWSYTDCYMTWFYSVSHIVTTKDAHRCPSSPTHEEILDNKQARDDHFIDVLPIWQSIMWITYEGIKSELLKRGVDDAVALTYSILNEA